MKSHKKDAASDFLQKTEKLNINKYMVAGPSKRGWATWLTMAVDKRVFAAVPIVMDLLNLNTVNRLIINHSNKTLEPKYLKFNYSI